MRSIPSLSLSLSPKQNNCRHKGRCLRPSAIELSCLHVNCLCGLHRLGSCKGHPTVGDQEGAVGGSPQCWATPYWLLSHHCHYPPCCARSSWAAGGQGRGESEGVPAAPALAAAGLWGWDRWGWLGHEASAVNARQALPLGPVRLNIWTSAGVGCLHALLGMWKVGKAATSVSGGGPIMRPAKERKQNQVDRLLLSP